MSDDIVENLKQVPQWLRILFMLGFAVVLYIAGMVLLVITVAQALFCLLTTRDNENLRNLGAAITDYVYEILQFLTYNSEHKPFPFSPFPFSDAEAAPSGSGEDHNKSSQKEKPANEGSRRRKTGTTVRKRTATRKTATPKSTRAGSKPRKATDEGAGTSAAATGKESD